MTKKTISSLDRMVSHWNDLLTNKENFTRFAQSFDDRYQAQYDEKSKPVLWVPADTDFYLEVTDIISSCCRYAHPAGDIYLPGYDEGNPDYLDLSAKFQASFQQAVMVYLLSEQALPEAKLHLTRLIIQRVDSHWSITQNGTVWLRDLLALRFLDSGRFLADTALLDSYLSAVARCIKQLANCYPNDSLRQINAHRNAIKLIHDAVLLDLIIFDRLADEDTAQMPGFSIFCLGLFQEKKIKQIKINGEERIVIAQTFTLLIRSLKDLSRQLFKLFTNYRDPQRNAVRTLDPYCYLFCAFENKADRGVRQDSIAPQFKAQRQLMASDEKSDAALLLVNYTVLTPQIQAILGDISPEIKNKSALYDDEKIREFTANLQGAVEVSVAYFDHILNNVVELEPVEQREVAA